MAWEVGWVAAGTGIGNAVGCLGVPQELLGLRQPKNDTWQLPPPVKNTRLSLSRQEI